MTIPAGWRSNGEPQGAYGIRLTLSAVDDWAEFDIRSLATVARSDVQDLIDAKPWNSTFFRSRAILRSVEFQNTSAAVNAQVSDRADGAVGTTDAPDPDDSYNLAMKNGGVAALRFATREEQTTFQYRGVGGAADLNVEIRFDVPWVTGENLTPGLS